MCKYCKVTESVSEKTNDCKFISKLRDGSRIYSLYLNRYIDRSGSINELILSNEVDYGEGPVTIKDKFVPIKYCPFCGEEL